jgi:hypothetical protein
VENNFPEKSEAVPIRAASFLFSALQHPKIFITKKS